MLFQNGIDFAEGRNYALREFFLVVNLKPVLYVACGVTPQKNVNVLQRIYVGSVVVASQRPLSKRFDVGSTFGEANIHRVHARLLCLTRDGLVVAKVVHFEPFGPFYFDHGF